MAKSARWSETWFRRGLWLVAVVFASFLIGLGSSVVDDLPRVEQRLETDNFLDLAQVQPLRAQQQRLQTAQRQAIEARDQAQLQWQQARSDTQVARDSFNSWIATRSATQRSEQDPEVMQRNQALEQLRQAERTAQQALQDQEQALLNARQQAAQVSQQLAEMEDAARQKLHQAERAQELRVFLYRLAITLPLLVLAGWLFVKKRKSTWWPFVWGFIFFALFAFFVELVPYLPDYGGYVRYIVGIVVTVLLGRYAILALNRYLEKQKLQESLPEERRREELSYDVALERLSKNVCPGCERPVDLKNTEIDFCPHCGIGLFDHCGSCDTRKSAFSRFCHSCGTAAGKMLPRPDAAVAASPASGSGETG